MTSGPYGDSAAAPDPYQYRPDGPYPGQAPPATPYPPAAYYAQPYPAAGYAGAYREPRNGLGTAALVLGIIGVVFCWIPFTGWALNILAIIFGAVGRNRVKAGAANNKSSAVAGLVLGVIGLGVWVIFIVVLMSAASSVGVLL